MTAYFFSSALISFFIVLISVILIPVFLSGRKKWIAVLCCMISFFPITILLTELFLRIPASYHYNVQAKSVPHGRTPPDAATNINYREANGHGTFLQIEFTIGEKDFIEWLKKKYGMPLPIDASGQTVYPIKENKNKLQNGRVILNGSYFKEQGSNRKDQSDLIVFDRDSGSVYMSCNSF